MQRRPVHGGDPRLFVPPGKVTAGARRAVQALRSDRLSAVEDRHRQVPRILGALGFRLQDVGNLDVGVFFQPGIDFARQAGNDGLETVAGNMAAVVKNFNVHGFHRHRFPFCRSDRMRRGDGRHNR